MCLQQTVEWGFARLERMNRRLRKDLSAGIYGLPDIGPYVKNDGDELGAINPFMSK